MTEYFSSIPIKNLPFTLSVKISTVLDTKSDDLILFLKKMNIDHNINQLPGKPIKLNIPIILIQDIPKKIKVSRRKSVALEKNSLVSSHIDDEELHKHRVESEKIPYDMFYNNNPKFIEEIRTYISSLDFKTDKASCDKTSKSFDPLTHQLIVKRYLDSLTPYRGLLLYHGLGSGKTCSSISIIEGMRQDSQVIVMTPASLQANYRTQMRYCGNVLFRNNNYWTFQKIKDGADLKSFYERTDIDDTYFLNNPELKKLLDAMGGIWVTDQSEPLKPSNYDLLNETEKEQIDGQIDLMIKTKYTFINYNGLRKDKWNKHTKNGKINPFNNSVLIIDEVHNFVSRIVNKININKTSISTELYEYIMDAENCRVVLLTGTPFINSPSELGVLFNLISGYTAVLNIEIQFKKPMSQESLKNLFIENGIVDLVEYKNPILKITKNPYGFLKLPNDKMIYNKKGNVYLAEFVDIILGILNSHENVSNPSKIKINITKFKKLPDKADDFNKQFVNGTTIKNKEYFQSKIVGMVSYLGDKKDLMPSIVKSSIVEDGKTIESDIHVEKIEMSKHQLDAYSQIRDIEHAQEKRNKGKKDTDEVSNSTYRVFSRAVCNFAFPSEPKSARRPMPNGDKTVKFSEALLDAITEEDKLNDIDGKFDTSDLENPNEKTRDQQYIKEIETVLNMFNSNPSDFFESEIPKLVSTVFDKPQNLLKYSPKFHRILQNIMNPSNIGCHLLYTNFRKLEGIGIFSIILSYYGYCQIVVKTVGESYELKLLSKYDIKTLKEIKCFALYTGTETAEEKEIIRNIYNSNYDALPHSIRQQLKTIFPDGDEIKNNVHGDVIQLLMITASGAEGIDLKNTRFVHITEPYWHHVRINQVIGRARRICSHSALEKDLQDVTVYMYISYFGTINMDEYPNIQNFDNNLSTDQSLYDIMQRKQSLSSVFLDSLKEAAIDCIGKCFTLPTSFKGKFISEIDYTQNATTGYTEKKKNKYIFNKLTIDGVPYVSKQKVSDSGVNIGDPKVFHFSDYAVLKQSISNKVDTDITPIGILVDGQLKLD